MFLEKAHETSPGIWKPSDSFLDESVEIAEKSDWKAIVRRQKTQIELVGTGTSLKIGPMTPCLPALGALLPPDDALVVTTLPLISFFHKVRYYHFDEPSESKLEIFLAVKSTKIG